MSTATRKKPYDSKKGDVIAKATDWYANASGVVFTDYRGLTVKELQKLRKELRKQGGEIHVLKNTLFRRAAGDDADKMPYELHNGPTAIAFVFENESQCAKAIVDFATASKKMQVKGGFFNGKVMTAKDVEALSKLPSREILISQVIGAIAAPLSNLIGTIEALYADPIRVIGAVADKVAEGSPIPASPKNSDAPAEPEVAEAPAEAAAEAPTEAPAEEVAETQE